MVLRTSAILLLFFVFSNSFSRTVVFDTKGVSIIKTSSTITIPLNVHLISVTASGNSCVVKSDLKASIGSRPCKSISPDATSMAVSTEITGTIQEPTSYFRFESFASSINLDMTSNF